MTLFEKSRAQSSRCSGQASISISLRVCCLLAQVYISKIADTANLLQQINKQTNNKEIIVSCCHKDMLHKQFTFLFNFILGSCPLNSKQIWLICFDENEQFTRRHLLGGCFLYIMPPTPSVEEFYTTVLKMVCPWEPPHHPGGDPWGGLLKVGWGTCGITNTQAWTKRGPVGVGITGLPSHQGVYKYDERRSWGPRWL